jgi:5-methylcytosine-specific restriction enzyme subunit McrC
MRVISLREYETSGPIVLSVQERDELRLLVPDLRVEPASGASDAYLLTPGSRVGAVALNELSIEIAPKLDIDRVLFLLSYSLGLARWGDRSFSMARAASLVEALVPVFAHHLERALRRGVLQGYRTEEDALMGVRGRIRFDDQVQRRFGMLLPVEVRFDEFTEDILENRLLKAALATLGHLRFRSETSRQALRRFMHVLELVTTSTYNPHDVPSVTYTRLNEHYRGAVEWASLILRCTSVESRHGGAVGTTVLFDMNAVFEEFVRTALREELRLTVRECPTGAECPSLFLDVGCRIRLEPDLSWWVAKRCRLVGDVKYKAASITGVRHPDLYQLLAYVTATNVQHGLLVYASSEDVFPITHDVSMAGKWLHVRSLQLAGQPASLRAAISGLARFLSELASANEKQVA